MPDSKSTSKPQQMGMKTFQGPNNKAIRQKKVVNINDDQFRSVSNLRGDQNPYIVDSFSKIGLNQNLNQSTGRLPNKPKQIVYQASGQLTKSPDQRQAKLDASDIAHLGQSVGRDEHPQRKRMQSNHVQQSIGMSDKSFGSKAAKNQKLIKQSLNSSTRVSVAANYNQQANVSGRKQSVPKGATNVNQSVDNILMQNAYNNKSNTGSKVTTSGQGSNAQLKISSAGINV